MELSKLKTEKKNHYISGNGTQHFSVQGQEIKNIHPEKISYTLGNGNSEKTSYILSKKAVIVFWENGNLKKFLTLQETELSELQK